MRPTRRIIIAIGSTLAVAALNAPTASAAPPAREVIPVQSDSIYTNLCAFPLRVQDQGTFIVQTFTDATGFVVRTTTTIRHYRAVLTNQATGYSMEVGAPGPEFVVPLRRVPNAGGNGSMALGRCPPYERGARTFPHPGAVRHRVRPGGKPNVRHVRRPCREPLHCAGRMTQLRT